MKLAFKDESVRVNVVQHGDDAFAAIEANPPDIIFTDDARKIAAFLKKHRAKLPRIPVVLLRGAFDSSASAAGQELADEVLTKPLQPDAMIDCVKRLLSARSTAAPEGESQPQPAERSNVDLDLEQYFDQLEIAFSEADHTPSRLDGEPWDGALASATDAGPQRAEVVRARLEHPTPILHGVTNELVDQITQRVLDRLGERLVRGTATEVVARLSKWLLVNEVEKGRSPT